MIFANNQITSALFNPSKHDISVHEFRAFSADERAAFYKLRGAKTDILASAKEIVSSFNYNNTGKQFAIVLSKVHEETLALFFKLFICSTHAMAENLKCIDMRNEQTAEICKLISAYDFDNAQEITAPERPLDTSDIDAIIIDRMTNSLESMAALMKEHAISVETAGGILASAWFFNHPTIQQSFMREMLMIAEVNLYEHQQGFRTLTDSNLIKILSGLVSISNNSYLPRI